MRCVPRDLDVVQRWFQQVITHPDGPVAGAASDEAQGLVRIDRGDLERMIRRSSRLSAAQRVAVYANAYYARLIECLGESFPMLRRTIGDQAFSGFAFDYLQRHPSISYTLGKLGEHFAAFLDEIRPDRDAGGHLPGVGWPDLLIDLARLEWTVERVFDGPGAERERTVTGEDLAAIAPERFGDCRVEPVVCMTLLRFGYPVNAYYTALRHAADGEHVPPPQEPGEEHAVITRRDYVVRRHVISAAQHAMLGALQRGATVNQAIAAVGQRYDGDDERLARDLRAWFAAWTSQQLFARVVAP